MALSTKEIKKFASFQVTYGAHIPANATPERAASLMAESRRSALSYYAAAQQDVQDSGYRVTQRVKDIIWAELKSIKDAEDAA